MEGRERTGFWAALAGALINVGAGFGFFLTQWRAIYDAEIAAGRPDEAIIVTYILPGLSDLIMVGGILMALGAYGFWLRQRWGWSLALTGTAITLVGGFFWSIPAMSRGLPPLYMGIFLPVLAIFLALVLYVRPLPGRLVVLSLFAGIAYVLTFMNGVASTDKILLTAAPLYALTQRLNWIAAAGWLVAVIAMLHLRPWARILAIGAGLLGFVAGAPLALVNMLEVGRFSMFSPGPLISLTLAVLLLAPAAAGWYERTCGGPERQRQEREAA